MMTQAYAKANGFSRPERSHTGWRAQCPTCDKTGPSRKYKGAASVDASAHNRTAHEQVAVAA